MAELRKKHLHYGEAFGAWTHLMKAMGCGAKYQLLANHARDSELRGFLMNMINDVVNPEVKAISQLLKDEGVQLPPAAPERPAVDGDQIPPAARFNDNEVAMCVQHDIAMAMMETMQIVAQATRPDFAMMFGKHHAQLVMQGARLLKLMADKGWLVEPPLHTNPGPSPADA